MFEEPFAAGVDQTFPLGLANLEWDQADLNANLLKLELPSGDSTNSPTFVIGIDIIDKDLGFWQGQTNPGWAVLDSTGTKYVDFRWKGVFFEFGSNAPNVQIAYNLPLNVNSTFVMGSNTFFQMYNGNGSYLVSNYSGITRLYNNKKALHIGSTGLPSIMSTPTTDDLYINGRLEVNSDTYFGNNAYVADGGVLVVGATTPITLGSQHTFQVLGTSAVDGGAIIGRFSNDVGESRLDFVKGRSATIGGTTIVQDNDRIGSNRYYAADGNDLSTLVAAMHVEVDDASPAQDDIGTAFVWSQMPGGGGAIRETMRLDAAGYLNYGTHNAITTETLSGYIEIKDSGGVTRKVAIVS